MPHPVHAPQCDATNPRGLLPRAHRDRNDDRPGGGRARRLPGARRDRDRIEDRHAGKALQVGLLELGEPSLFTCPECPGILLRLKSGGGLRIRCHTGHAYTAASLLAELTEKVEEALWNAVRSVQESTLLMEHVAAHLREAGDEGLAATYRRKAAEALETSEWVTQAVMRHEVVGGESAETGR